MRKLEYLSPTSLKLYMEDKVDFYMQYLADTRAPRGAQTQPMSIGSSFDAYIKSHIYQLLFGKGHNPQFEFETIFEKQVETQWRDWARTHGKYVFEQYIASGALADLMLELNKAIGTPRFEFDLKGEVRSVDKNIDGVTFLGKPDIHFTNSAGLGITFDWKVNGYCSKTGVSPKPGYVCIKPGFMMHNDCNRKLFKDMIINVDSSLDRIDKDWANQLSIYSWLCGEPVGGKFVTAIDQVCCNNNKNFLAGSGGYPQLRFAQHRLLVDEQYQHQLFDIAKDAWNCINNGHYFSELTKEESDFRCESLNKRAAEQWIQSDDPTEQAFKEMTTIKRKW